jgi:hypothetical protein
VYPMPDESETLPYPVGGLGTGFYPALTDQPGAEQNNISGLLLFVGLVLLLVGAIGWRLWQRRG